LTNIYLAVSGGIDSMYLLHCLVERKANIKVINYHYGDPYSDQVDNLLREVCNQYKVPLILSSELEGIHNKDCSNNNKEANWRDSRYKFFARVLNKTNTASNERPVLLVAHHETDQLVSWIMSRLKNSRRCFIPLIGNHQGVKVVRPLYRMAKEDIKREVIRKSIPYLEDPENSHGDRAAVEKLIPALKEAISQMQGAFANQYEDWLNRYITSLDKEDQALLASLS